MRHDDSMCDHWYFVLYTDGGEQRPAHRRKWRHSIPFNRLGPALSTLDEVMQDGEVAIGVILKWCPLNGLASVRATGCRSLIRMYTEEPEQVLDTALGTIKSAVDCCVKEQLAAKGKVQ